MMQLLRDLHACKVNFSVGVIWGWSMVLELYWGGPWPILLNPYLALS